MIVEGKVQQAALAQPDAWYCMFLSPWRHPDGRVISTLLRVAPDCSAKAATAAQRSFRRDTWVRVTAAKLAKGRGFSYWNAADISKVEKIRALDLAVPPRVIVRDEVLGTFELDLGRGELVGRRSRCELSIAVTTSKEPAALVVAARPRVLGFERAMPAIRRAMQAKLLPLYNKTWRESRRVLDAKAFDKRLRLTGVQLDATRTTLYFSSGDLFGDHGAEVRLSARGAISEILIS